METREKNKKSPNEIYPVAVIGGGSAGTMAVMRAVLNNDRCLFFPGTRKHQRKSRAFWVTKVENMPDYHHYKKGIQGPNKKTVTWLSQCPLKDNLIHKPNMGIDKLEKLPDGIFQLADSEGDIHFVRYVILCTGVMDVQPVIGGTIDPILPYANVQLADYCLRCDGHHVLGKKVSIIGHGRGAVNIACLLYERYGPQITLLPHDHDPLYTESDLKILKKYKIKIQQGEIVEVLGNYKEKKLEGYRLKNGIEVNTEITFISLGMIVYNDLAKQAGANMDNRGFVITDEAGLTSVDGLYVAGDLRANTKKQIYTAWDGAVDSADAINSRIRRDLR
ncbi:MAG: NAD(P)/FAD-dependent oxidoreductase [Halobacteriovoraceae bacterium]|nr:NAD(P)/FAD-dependent oxidoreductase [Halobacteriovoraceae bacterium]